ncbi:MAG: hypothetical protein ACRCUQ_02010 [Alphaproteobacteria bacterium]
MRLKIFTSISCLFLGVFSGKAAIKPEDLWGGVAYLEGKDTPNAKHFARILAAGAMATGTVVPNLRFYGLCIPFYDENGKRCYIKDRSCNAFGKLIQILFPSPVGMLNTITSGDRNFGRYATPETVAKLFKFADIVQNSLVQNSLELDENTINLWKSTIVTTLNLEKKGSLNKLVKNLLNFIQESIVLEGEVYPQGLTKTLISSFFQQNFNNLEDVQTLIHNLYAPPSPNEEHNPPIIQPLTKETLDAIFLKQSLSDSDLFALHYSQSINQKLPYTNTEFPIGNAPSHPYNREKNLTENVTFPDCAETTLRHLFNFFLFNPKTQAFDLSHLPVEVQSTPYYQNLKTFYEEHQPVDFTNNGSQRLRDAWNTVVGGLGEKIFYREGHYNIASYLDNLIRVFEKLLKLDLGASQEADDAETWLENSFKIIFKTLNPHYTCDISFDGVQQTLNKLIGSIYVTVFNQAKEKQFYFEALAAGYHTKIQKFVIPQKDSKNDENFYKEKLPDAQDLFTFLLDPQRATEKKALFYGLMTKNLSQGNDERLAWLNQLQNFFKNKSLDDYENSQDLLKNFTQNIMEDISWGDVLDENDTIDTINTINTINEIFWNESTHEFFRPFLKKEIIKVFEKDCQIFKENSIFFRITHNNASHPTIILGERILLNNPFTIEMVEKTMLNFSLILKNTGYDEDYGIINAFGSLRRLYEDKVIVPESILKPLFLALEYLKQDIQVGFYTKEPWEKVMRTPILGNRIKKSSIYPSIARQMQ